MLLAPSTISYDNSGRFATVTFHVGVSQINIPYSISNDQIVEGSEYVDFKIVGANSSSGSTTINNDRIRIRIDDDDGNVFMPHVGIYPGITVDEGNPTRSFLVLSEAVSHNVTLRVSTNHNNYREANYPAPNDYQAISNLTIMIPAGNDFVWVPVLTHHNDDPNDAMFVSISSIKREESSELMLICLSTLSADLLLVGKWRRYRSRICMNL